MNDLLQGVDVISGPLVEAYLLKHTVLLLDEFLRVCWSTTLCWLTS
jgi:hypothetical protein